MKPRARALLIGALVWSVSWSVWGAGAARADDLPRIVTLAPHLAELVCAVDACDALVGVARHTTVPEAAAKLPQVGDAFALNLEVLLALRPDAVLAWQGGMAPAAVARAQTLGVRVHWLPSASLQDIPRNLRQIGLLLGRVEAAEHAAQRFEIRLAELRQRYANRPRVRAFYQIETAPAFSINRHSPIHEALDVCGADNVFADLPAIAAIVSPEAVIAARPDVVVYAQQDNAQAIDAYWQRLPMLRPAQPAYRVTIDADLLTRPSPRVLDGIAQLCEGLERHSK